MSTTIVMFGAELNAETERQTAVDLTAGGPMPPGVRDAAAADRPGPDFLPCQKNVSYSNQH